MNGRGEPYKAGGKVVKNVTGYDLCKLLAGAYGTLGVLTEVTVKVLPKPETARTVLVLGLKDAAGQAVLAESLNSPHEVSGAPICPRTSHGARTSLRYRRRQTVLPLCASKVPSHRPLIAPRNSWIC